MTAIKTVKNTNKKQEKEITYEKVFWLFIIGSVMGVVIEGFYCIYAYGRWETHVNTVFGPYCLIYGIGTAGLYIGAVKLRGKSIFVKFAVFAITATIIEYLCGLLLLYGLNMRAWDYSENKFNIQGLICPSMLVAWGIFGIIFSAFLPKLENLFKKTKGTRKIGKVVCAVFSVFMAVNILFTTACIIRWSKRHQNIPPKNKFETMMDSVYNDAVMEKKFCEWRFLDSIK